MNPQNYFEDNNHFDNQLLYKSKSEEYMKTPPDDIDKKLKIDKTNINQYINLNIRKSNDLVTKNKPFEEDNKEIYFSKRK